MRRRLTLVAIGVVLLLAASVSALVPGLSAAAKSGSSPLASLGPPPRRCFYLGDTTNICGPYINGYLNGNWPYAPNSHYLDSTYYGQLGLQPHVVEPGQVMTGTATAALGGKPAWGTPPGKVLHGCGNSRSDPDYTCTFIPDGSIEGWSQMQASFTGFFGTGYSADYYYVLPKTPTTTVITGTVSDADGNPIVDGTVTISGAGTVKTDASGFYSMTVNPGTYSVSASSTIKGTTTAAKPTFCSPGSTHTTSCSVKPSDASTAVANFDLPADAIQGTVTQSNGSPYSGVTVNLSGKLYQGGNYTTTAVTDSEGDYSQDVPPGTYTVSASLPSGDKGSFSPTHCDSKTQAGSCLTAITLGQKETDSFKFIEPLVVNVITPMGTVATGASLQQQVTNGVCDVTPTEAYQSCTLAMAVQISNADGGRYISFDIPGGGTPSITSTTGFSLSAPATIDGTTQPQSGMVSIVGTTPDLAGVSTSPDWFVATAGVQAETGSAGTVLKGLAITGFRSEVAIAATNVTVVNSDLGVDPTTGQSNLQSGYYGQDGVSILGTYGDTIGAPQNGNHIAGQYGNPGVSHTATPITGDDLADLQAQVIAGLYGGGAIVDIPGSSGTVVQDNTLLDPPDATLALSGGYNTLGGANPGDGNTVTGGSVVLEGAYNVVQGNTFTNASVVAGPSAQIGGLTSTAGMNSGNTFACSTPGPSSISTEDTGQAAGETALEVANKAVVQGNAFNGTSGCMWQGLSVDGSGVTVGGSTAEDGNSFTHIPGPYNDATAFAALAVGGPQVLGGTLQAFSLTPTTFKAAATQQAALDENSLYGWLSEQFDTAQALTSTSGAPLGVSIENNSFESNTGGAAIDIFQGNGVTVTQNSMTDNDGAIVLGFHGYVVNPRTLLGGGPNNSLPYPLLDSIGTTTKGGISVSGTVEAARLGAYAVDTIELYGQESCAGGTPTSGQGKTYVGTDEVTAGVMGSNPFVAVYSYPQSFPEYTATSNDNSGDTSEFSACVGLPHH